MYTTPLIASRDEALAFVAATKGYRLTLAIPDSMSHERRALLRSLGADFVLTPAAEGMQGAIRQAHELFRDIPHAWMPHQFDNPANPKIHETTTGPEIWTDTGGKVDIIVAGVGTGGTITGVTRYRTRIVVLVEVPLQLFGDSDVANCTRCDSRHVAIYVVEETSRIRQLRSGVSRQHGRPWTLANRHWAQYIHDRVTVNQFLVSPHVNNSALTVAALPFTGRHRCLSLRERSTTFAERKATFCRPALANCQRPVNDYVAASTERSADKASRTAMAWADEAASVLPSCSSSVAAVSLP